MSKAQRRTKRRRSAGPGPVVDRGAAFVRLLMDRLTNPDPRSHAEFLADMRAKQAAGKLNNPAVTGPLLDRLERAI